MESCDSVLYRRKEKQAMSLRRKVIVHHINHITDNRIIVDFAKIGQL